MPTNENIELRSVVDLLRETNTDAKVAPEFFHSLLTLELYAIGSRRTVKPGDFTGSHFELVSFADGAGASFVPIFSDREFIPPLQDGFHRVALRGRALLDLTRGQRVVLNPGRPELKVFSAAQIETILDRLVHGGPPEVTP